MMRILLALSAGLAYAISAYEYSNNDIDEAIFFAINALILLFISKEAE